MKIRIRFRAYKAVSSSASGAWNWHSHFSASEDDRVLRFTVEQELWERVNYLLLPRACLTHANGNWHLIDTSRSDLI